MQEKTVTRTLKNRLALILNNWKLLKINKWTDHKREDFHLRI